MSKRNAVQDPGPEPDDENKPEQAPAPGDPIPFPKEKASDPPKSPAVPPDMFERLKGLRLNQAFAAGAVKMHFSSFPVRRPTKNSFFRVHPSGDYLQEIYLFTDKEESGMPKETYTIDPDLYEQLDEEWQAVFQGAQLCLGIERHATRPFVWPLKFPTEGQRDNDYWRGERECADKAKTEWIKLVNVGGTYSWAPPSNAKIPEPKWIDEPFTNIIRVAFKGLVIDSPDHHILKALRGE
jgi:hypothetical protein